MPLTIPPALRRHQRCVVAAAADPISRFETLEARRLLAVTVDAGGPYSFTETDDTIAAVLTLNATASGATGTANFTWDLNNDGVFTDGTGATLVLSSSSLENLGINQHRPTPYPIHVKVQDDIGTATDSAELTVQNALPQVDLFVSTEGGFAEGNTLDVNPSVTKDMFAAADATYTYSTVVTLDGVELVPNPPVPSTTAGALGPNLNYTLPDDGASLQIVTTVTDEDGGSTTLHWPAAPAVQPVANVPISIPAWSDAPTGLTAGQSFEAGVAVTHASVDVLSYRWRLFRLIDGVYTAVVDETTADSIHSFTPSIAGTYAWQCNVTDDDGSTAGRNRIGFIVQPGTEVASVVYNGQQHFTSSSPTDLTAEVTLRASVLDSAGGDVSRAAVRFFNIFTNEDYAVVPVVAIAAGSGVASHTFTQQLLVEENPKFLHVGAEIISGGAYAPAAAQTIITVSTPGDGRIVGGGSLVNSAAAGALGAASGSTTLFAFQAKAHPKTGVISGGAELRFSGNGVTYLISSTSISSLITSTSESGSHAYMRAVVDVYDSTDPLNTILLHSGVSLEIALTDAGKGGKSDSVAFGLWNDVGGGLLFANHWENGSATEDLLSSGNITVWH